MQRMQEKTALDTYRPYHEKRLHTNNPVVWATVEVTVFVGPPPLDPKLPASMALATSFQIYRVRRFTGATVVPLA